MSLILSSWPFKKILSRAVAFTVIQDSECRGMDGRGLLILQEGQMTGLGVLAVVYIAADGLYTWVAQRDGASTVVFLGK